MQQNRLRLDSVQIIQISKKFMNAANATKE